jgi:DNA-nicking Smr family endonuclease
VCRTAPQSRDTIDLHGTSVAEATVIVKEILQQDGCSPCTHFYVLSLPTHNHFRLAKPFNIITGRGVHSANGVGVLKPAVRAALVEDGWHVGTWDGGLVVKGKKVYTG